MLNDRKKIGIIVIIIGFILLAAIIYFGFFQNKPATTDNGATTGTSTANLPSTPETGTTTPGDRPRDTHKYDISKEAPHKFNETDLQNRAKSYSQRLGSYSSQSDYSNFTDLKMYMTSSLQEWSDKYVAELKSKNKSNAYYGITTEALVSEVKSFDDKAGTAQVIVTTQRSESTDKIGGGQPYIQKLDLSFVKVNNEWLIDKAYWEKR